MQGIVIFILEIVGTIAFAMSGALVALEKKMDILGVIILGATTAVGGGIIRDIILGNTPPQAFQDPIYLILSIFTSAAMFIPIIGKQFDPERNRRKKEAALIKEQQVANSTAKTTPSAKTAAPMSTTPAEAETPTSTTSALPTSTTPTTNSSTNTKKTKIFKSSKDKSDIITTKHMPISNKVLTFADSVGLSIFTIVGMDVAYQMPANSFVAVFVGVATGVAGGLFRDIMAQKTPSILSDGFYASAAIIGAIVAAVMHRFCDWPLTIVVGTSIILILRVLAAHYG